MNNSTGARRPGWPVFVVGGAVLGLAAVIGLGVLGQNLPDPPQAKAETVHAVVAPAAPTEVDQVRARLLAAWPELKPAKKGDPLEDAFYLPGDHGWISVESMAGSPGKVGRVFFSEKLDHGRGSRDDEMMAMNAAIAALSPRLAGPLRVELAQHGVQAMVAGEDLTVRAKGFVEVDVHGDRSGRPPAVGFVATPL